jgi:hypothetical protein
MKMAVQAQTALVSKDQDKAKALLMESLQNLNPDDWAGYMLLFSCCLPSTALPFGQAAAGLITVQAGFGGLEGILTDPKHWASMQPGADAMESSYEQACSELESFLSSIVSKVTFPVHTCIVTDTVHNFGSQMQSGSDVFRSLAPCTRCLLMKLHGGAQ